MRSLPSWSLRCAVATGLVLCMRPDASACDLVGWSPHEIDSEEAEVDQLAPGTVDKLEELDIRRGIGPACCGGQCSATSCDDLGWIALTVAPPQDDRTSAEEMGYAFEVTGGTPPDGINWPTLDAPGRAPGDRFILGWLDGSTDEQEAFDFTVVVYAIDRGGNVSDASPAFRVSDPGHSGRRRHRCRGANCNVTDTDSTSPVWMALLLLARRRRRPR